MPKQEVPLDIVVSWSESLMVSHCVLMLMQDSQVTVPSQLSSLAAMPVFIVGATAGSQIPMVLAWSTDDKGQGGEAQSSK